MKLHYLFNLFLIVTPLVLSSGYEDIDKSFLKNVKKCTANKEGIIIQL